MDERQAILAGETALGLELGSTRIKAVLLSGTRQTLAEGEYAWENSYRNNFWTYDECDIWSGIQGCYAMLKEDVYIRYGITLCRVGALGVSAMMHGYLAFDNKGALLTPFRTWRNNNAEPAARLLTARFGFPVPARWSVAHLYQAILNGEPHVAQISYLTTLAGYVHHRLTGQRVLGIGDASGMFPIDVATKRYDENMLLEFDRITAAAELPWRLSGVLPEIRVAGESTGMLTSTGALLLDPAGDLSPGIPLCPPEGDAGTGMVATNSVKAGRGNVSAGTSIFGMIVLSRPLKAVHPEIDLVATPAGDLVAMAHCNNCTSELNDWVSLFDEFSQLVGAPIEKNKLYERLFQVALAGDHDCGGVLAYNYTSGENITGIAEGRPMLLRKTESAFTLSNLMRAQLYASMATLKIGLDVLLKGEGVRLDSVCGHGGLFKTAGVAQRFLAAALNAPVTVSDTANAGGAWGMAVLALYMRQGKGETLEDYLDQRVFANATAVTLRPRQEDVRGMDAYLQRFVSGLSVVREAVTALKE